MFKLNFDVPDDPIVKVQTTNNRGFSPDEVAERCVEKLISVSDTAHPAIRDQAKACLLYTSPSPRDLSTSRMPSSA